MSGLTAFCRDWEQCHSTSHLFFRVWLFRLGFACRIYVYSKWYVVVNDCPLLYSLLGMLMLISYFNSPEEETRRVLTLSFFSWSWNWSCFYSVLQKEMGIGCSFEFPPKEFRWPGVLSSNPNFPSGIIWNDAPHG